jgi:hypothetical protein
VTPIGAYLRAIIGDAQAVERALRTTPPPPAPEQDGLKPVITL